MQFTLEHEQDGEIAYLDTLVIRKEIGFKFKIYRKTTNKEDYVHFYSGHSERVKSGIVIGFFLRALRICDQEYLNDEIEHIYNTFMRLKYPKGFLIKQREKAERIRKKKKTTNRNTSKTERRSWITIPNSKSAEVISRTLEKAGTKVSMTSGRKTKEILERKPNQTSDTTPKSVVYEIPCGGCRKSYVGETGRGVKTRLKEHRSDAKYHRTSNAIILHIDNHLPDWENTRILEKNVQKQTRKILEAAHILSRDTFNSRTGFITLASCAVSLVVDPP